MSAAADQSNFPTMIIPRGTEIRVNHQGQLSIRTPGNLVIQNSGNYSEIESTNGSIRIEENVTVEAVSIRAGQACFIQGTLTAWKVHAKRISLEDKAKAFIMLQESENLELARGARLVGNFANEKELFLMMGKFTSQLKELPGGVDMGAPSALPARPASIPGSIAVSSTGAEYLRQAQTLIEQELARADFPATEAEGLREVLYAIREHNVSRIATIYRAAFAEIKSPSESLRQAYENLERFFATR
jgi:hypothetical protein